MVLICFDQFNTFKVPSNASVYLANVTQGSRHICRKRNSGMTLDVYFRLETSEREQKPTSGGKGSQRWLIPLVQVTLFEPLTVLVRLTSFVLYFLVPTTVLVYWLVITFLCPGSPHSY